MYPTATERLFKNKSEILFFKSRELMSGKIMDCESWGIVWKNKHVLCNFVHTTELHIYLCNLISVDLSVSPTQNLLHSQDIEYIPATLAKFIFY